MKKTEQEKNKIVIAAGIVLPKKHTFKRFFFICFL